MLSPEDAAVGCLLGTAVGDALGLPFEALTPRRQKRLCPDLDSYHFFFGRGMVSDDTEHTCMVAQALIASGGESGTFRRSLAWRLRWWMLALPAGVGLATLRAGIKLWLGFPPTKSGVYSAGNGPAMRSALLGVLYGDEPGKMCRMVRAATLLTHTDPRACFGATAVALAAHLSRAGREGEFGPRLRELPAGEEAGEFLELVKGVEASVKRGESTEAYAAGMGWERGVSGYVYHTVPAALHAWLTHPRDITRALRAIIRCGGDTDTTAAVTGAIVGAGVGRRGIPDSLLQGLMEWPRSVEWMEGLARTLVVCDRPARPPGLFAPSVLARNLFFLGVILSHGLRRLLPPY